METFADVIEPLNGRLKHVMETLWQLYAIHGISSCLGDFLQVSHTDCIIFIISLFVLFSTDITDEYNRKIVFINLYD